MNLYILSGLVLFMNFFFGSSFAQLSSPIISKPAPWIKAIEFDPKAKPAAGQEESFYYLVIDEQENIREEARYFHVAYKILSTEGVQSMSDISVDFDPVYQKLHLHQARIHRGNEVINQLSHPIKTIQREQSMDRYLYDGSLTAIIHLADVRVGDIIEYSYTTTGYNPAFEGHFATKINFTYGVPYEFLHRRLVAPVERHLSFLQHKTDISVQVTEHKTEKEYTWTQKRKSALINENNTPSWFDANEYITVTDFASWGEVAKWAAKQFEISDRDLQQLRTELNRQLKQDDPDAFILNAIRFVQDDIRYLGFEHGLNSHKPHAPLKVLQQRFGDCKDKSLLLCALLRSEGIEAWPVLVNTVRGKVLDKALPSAHAFDHCVVQIKAEGRSVYYVDPTLSQQGGSLFNMPFPQYSFGLVVEPQTRDLTELPTVATGSITEDQQFAMTNLEGEAFLQISTTYTGSPADDMRRHFLNNTLETIQKNYTSYYGNLYPDIEVVSPIEVKDNRRMNSFNVTETYRIPTFWKPTDNPDNYYAELYPQTISSYFSFQKASRTTPYALSHPVSFRHVVQVKFPEEWTVQPERKVIESDFYEYNYMVYYDDRTLTLERNYLTKDDHIPSDYFQDFVRDHTAMSDDLSFELTFNKKVASVRKGASWFGVITGLIALGVAIWLVLHIFYYYDPLPAGRTSQESLSIGGWLILPAIGLCIAPIRMVLQMLDFPEVYDNQTWSALFELARLDLLAVLFITHIYNIFALCFSVLVLVLFFQRRSSLPRILVIFFTISCLAQVADTFVSMALDPSTSVPGAIGSVIGTVISTVIWVPYFTLSQRVKNTFVERIADDEDDDFTIHAVSGDPWASVRNDQA